MLFSESQKADAISTLVAGAVFEPDVERGHFLWLTGTPAPPWGRGILSPGLCVTALL